LKLSLSDTLAERSSSKVLLLSCSFAPYPRQLPFKYGTDKGIESTAIGERGKVEKVGSRNEQKVLNSK
jgi:hypothetical protein